MIFSLISKAVTPRPSPSHSAHWDRCFLRVCLGVPCAVLLLFFVLPMSVVVWRSVLDDGSGTPGWGNYAALLHTPRLAQALAGSLALGGATTAIAVGLGFVVAYGIERCALPGRRLLALSMSLPVLAPSLVLGLGLIFLLGRNGLLARLTGTRPDIYGVWGVLIADVIYALPEAVLILRAALRRAERRQYEAAEMLGAGAWQRLRDITLPGARYGLLSAAFVVFTVTVTDFGNAVVIGGNYPLLANEIYNQVSGQMRFGLGAVLGMLLMLPALLSVWIERLEAKGGGMDAGGAGQGMPWRTARDVPIGCLCLGLAALIVAVVASVVAASFVQLWPYRFVPTLRHYTLGLSNGFASLWLSMRISALVALAGTGLLFLMAFAIRQGPGRLARGCHALASTPVSVPGLVLGLAYALTFNSAWFPWPMWYGSAALVAACNLIHYLTQAYAIVSTGMRRLPRALEDAVSVLGGGPVQQLRDLYRPAMAVTLAAVAAFLFMRSMVTLSAVIFLVTPDLPLAAVTVMRLDEAGLTSQAAAFSTCIMVAVGAVAALLHTLVQRSARGVPRD